MSRSKPKMTMRQVEDVLEAVGKDLEALNQMIRVLFAEADKINLIMVRMLDAQGLLHNEACPECDFKINTPILEDIALPTTCPSCQHILREEEE